MMWRLALLFTIIPAIELFLLIELGTIIGPLATVLIILVTGLVGAWLAKREGLAVLRALAADLQRGLPPADRIMEAVLVLVGGVLLVTPGLMTDVTGLLLVFPLSRRRVAPFVMRWILARFELRELGEPAAAGGFGEGAAPGARQRAPDERRLPFDHPTR